MPTVPVLLDTHAFIWAATDDSRLSDRVKALYRDRGEALALSVASIWEMAIKASLGRLLLRTSLATLVDKARTEQGIGVVDISPAHALRVEHLPYHHRDPFDRLLAAQALVEGMSFASRDRVFDAYGVRRIW